MSNNQTNEHASPAASNEASEYQVTPPNPPAPEHAGHEESPLEDEDFKNMEEIEKEMAKAMGASSADFADDDEEDDIPDDDEFEENLILSESAATGNRPTGGVLPAGAMPTVNGKLSAHAKEFWFPESRECKCCRGFKHGCDCATKNGFIACQEAGCVDEASRGKKAAPTPSPRGNNSGGYIPARSPRNDNLPSPTNNANQWCRFEFAPGGCRFGSACRFKHQSTAGPQIERTNSYGSAESPKGDKRAFCPYFMKGNCDFGDKCRFAHI